jgi:GNAT superfamily N-acetyltransferase
MSGGESNGSSWLKRALKAAAGALLGSYRINRIYQLPAGAGERLSAPHVTIRRLEAPPNSAADAKLLERFSYAGEDAHGFGLFVDDELASICWLWGHRRFDDPLLWVLKEGDVILVDLLTAEKYNGRGLAPVLVSFAAEEMRRLGKRGLYTWMWFTHRASSRVFDKAGWVQIAWVVEIHPFGSRRPLRISWRTR